MENIPAWFSIGKFRIPAPLSFSDSGNLLMTVLFPGDSFRIEEVPYVAGLKEHISVGDHNDSGRDEEEKKGFYTSGLMTFSERYDIVFLRVKKDRCVRRG